MVGSKIWKHSLGPKVSKFDLKICSVEKFVLRFVFACCIVSFLWSGKKGKIVNKEYASC
jgi:hypothetical protein